MARLFGTDGVRGVANKELTCETAFKLGQAAVAFQGTTILIGKDTRLSGDMLEAAVSAGIMSMGGTALLAGIIPTPAIALLVRELHCDGGIVISASHNPPEYNGIKLFDSQGFKLPDAVEDEIEAYLAAGGPPVEELPGGDEVGVALPVDDACELYVAHAVSTVANEGIDFTGLKVALDVGHGASCMTSAEALRRLGAEVVVVNEDFDGTDINVQCGSTHLEPLRALVAETGADVGIAHDGDADRVMLMDAKGNEIDGDVMEAVCAIDLHKRGLLPGGTAVLTADDDYVVPMAQLASGDVLWFGQGHTRDSEVHADHIAADAADHAEFTMTDAHGEQVTVHLGIPGRHNVMNALAAATVALRYGMPLTAIAQTLAAQHTISPHRMALSTVSRQGASFELIDDSFNANPDSMKAGLDGLRAWNANDGRQPFRVALLGAMLELGADERELHASVGEYAAGLGLDAIITVGSPSDAHLNVLAESLAEGATRGRAASVDCVQTIDEAERIVLDLAKNHTDTVVLLKGSHASGLSALAERWA